MNKSILKINFIVILACAWQCCTSTVKAQYSGSMDLDFERPHSILPWMCISGANVKINTEQFYHGKRSFYLEADSNSYFEDNIALEQSLSKELFSNHHLYATLAFRTLSRSTLDTFEIVYYHIDGSEHKSTIALSSADSEWKTVSLELNIDSDFQNGAMRLLWDKRGPIWIDNIQLTIDGIAFRDTMPRVMNLPEEQIKTIRSNIVPIRLNSESFPERKLSTFFRNISVVGLGEGVHGSHEFAQLKVNIAKTLLDQGFNTVALENGYEEVKPIDAYVNGGPGNLDSLMDNLKVWCFQSEELKSLFEWMRRKNLQSRRRMEVVGIDMQFTSQYDDCATMLKNQGYPGLSKAVDSARSII